MNTTATNPRKGLRVIVAGGGTGGHIFPALAIAHAIKEMAPDTEFLFVGARGKMEMEKVPQAGYKIEGIDIAGFDRSSLIKNIGLPIKLIKSFFQVRSILNRFRPHAVIGVGGYSSFPVLRLAQLKGIDTFIHESNSFAGKSNILLGKKATRVFVASSGMEKFFPAEKIQITGNPVRTAIVNSTVTREEGIRFFELDPSKKTVLVTGGSLGARGINEAIDAGLEKLQEKDIQLIWQTGKPYAATAARRAEGMKGVWTNDFITRMENAFAAADVVVSRSGAMAIAELCVVQKPVILVPFPFAAEDHQTANAKHLEMQGAGTMIKDADAKTALVPAMIELIEQPERQQQYKEQIGKLAVRDADKQVAKAILDLINKKK